MHEFLVYGDTLPEAYHGALEYLINADIIPCSDWNTTQKEISMTMVVEHPLQEPRISKCFFGDPRSLEQYCQEMTDGILDFEVDKGNWKYTYHDRMVRYPVDNQEQFPGQLYIDQMQFVIDELRRNPDSRRAVIDIRDNSYDAYSEDPACLQHMQFFIRDNKLHMKVLFRSNDACKAAFMNAFALIKIQEKIANQLQLEVGTYTHRANSFHCYARDYEMLEKYVERINSNDITQLTYSYEEDWKPLMDEAKPMIATMVDSLLKK